VDTVAAALIGLSRARVAQLLASGQLTLNGEPVAKSTKVQAGDLLEAVDASAKQLELHPQQVPGVNIVHDDDAVVVVEKPAGVAAHPSLAWEGPSVVEHLLAAGYALPQTGPPERRGIVHRLDVGTSGLLVVAKTEPAFESLKRQFKQRKVEKLYHALVQGQPESPEGVIDAPIGRHPQHDWKMAVVAGGREAITEYQLLAAHPGVSLLQLRLHTGRTHQIRVHLQAIKHPVVGDPIYGGDPALAAQLGLGRQWLHAVKLGFRHPESGEWLEFSSAYPADLANALELVS
jgi:23S rRNA pseudouridine1911/1915/1917 synthase